MLRKVSRISHRSYGGGPAYETVPPGRFLTQSVTLSSKIALYDGYAIHRKTYSLNYGEDLNDGLIRNILPPRDPVENPFSLWSSVNLGATLCRKRTDSQGNTEAAHRTTEKKPRVELIGRISRCLIT
jgi:hypothetical protein